MTEEQTESGKLESMSDERHTEKAQDWLHGAMKNWDEMSDQGKYEVVNQADCHLQEILGIGRDNVDATVSDNGRMTYLEKDKISNDDMECTCGPNEACSECPPRQNKRETCSHIYCSKSVEECNIH